MSLNNKFPAGKIKHKILNNLFKNYVSDLSMNDKSVILGSNVGEDAAVIDNDGNQLLVVKTDPITFTTDQIGYYVVNINVNDIVCTGATPKWFLSTILLPENKTTFDLVKSIFKDIHDTCQSMNISVVGGHTEVTQGLKRPVIIGSLIGEVERKKLVKSSGAEPGDVLILTKGIFIEGTSIIAREKEKKLKQKGFDSNFIEKCKNYLFNPGISVYKEALLANQHFKIKAMHDPTEGGLATGVAEIAISSNTGVLLEKKKKIILPEAFKLSVIFDLDPYNTLASGSLLIVIEKKYAENLIQFLKKNQIIATKIGKFIEKERGLLIKDEEGKIKKLEYSEIDDITKVFNNNTS